MKENKLIEFGSEFFVPKGGFQSKFEHLYDIDRVIGILRDEFESQLERNEVGKENPNIREGLNLKRKTSPLFLESGLGMNDDLQGWQKKVMVNSPAVGKVGEVVQSLAKWKRKALHVGGYKPGQGIWTNMNAIRQDEDILDNIHSVYVDQWDCEKVMEPKDRNLDYLYNTVKEIAAAVYRTQDAVQKAYPQLDGVDTRPVEFASSRDLLKMDCFKGKTPKEIEDAMAKDFGTVFISGIGGGVWDGRAPDYEDLNLNGDLFFWSKVLNRSVELLSGGIRVDAATLEKQLRDVDVWDARKDLEYHKAVLSDEYPQTIGWGVGQSRLSLLLLDMVHIGQVQSSMWDDKTLQTAKDNDIQFMPS